MALVVVDHDRGRLDPATLEAVTFARGVDEPVEALVAGRLDDEGVAALARHGVETLHRLQHELLADYGPETWGAAVAWAIGEIEPELVLAPGTDRGNETLAQAAARLDLPFAANVIELEPGDPTRLVRIRWGGSLLEDAELDAEVVVASVGLHAVEAVECHPDADGPEVDEHTPDIDAALARSVVADRVEREAGLTLATAPVVVGGGRGVGSAEGFAPLEELAELLGGVVGCSRAVTNNGWRNHADQVGQTGTRIAPEVYIACGISGAIQHWVGAKAAKTIIAVNTDPEANMVTKAGYAVIGDLHEVVPAISAEIRRRRGA
ncbi:MAG: electron transfer flavoprotein subunit alpha/FixB family protein [Actinomyces sp.]|nr:MAG: electron transfer flavoprotein subunit alpha/FixB family protein [Actinomyces sp.]